MAVIVFETEHGKSDYELLKDMVNLGRAEENDIVLTGKGVSRRHAMLKRNDNTWSIHDLQSSCGTIVNGQEIQNHTLQYGDEIQLGRTRLFFVEEASKVKADLVKSSGKMIVKEQVKTLFMDIKATGVSELNLRLEKALEELYLLVEVGAAINRLTDVNEILALLMQKVTDLTKARRGMIVLYDSDRDNFVPMVVRDMEGEAADINNFKASKTILKKAIENKSGLVTHNALQDQRFSMANSVMALDIRSVMCVPLMSGDKALGAVYIESAPGAQEYNNRDLSFITAIAQQAAIALEKDEMYREMAKKERLEQELSIARTIQEGALPRVCPEMEGYELDAMYRFANEVGGDSLALIPLDNGSTAVFIADVSGKGVSGALLAVMLKGVIGMECQRDPSPSRVLENANKAVVRELENLDFTMFVTAILAIFHPDGKLELAKAGHEDMLVFRKNGTLERLGGKGFPLGWVEDATYEETKTVLSPSDRVVLFTDGIVEAENEDGELFEDDRLIEIVKAHPDYTPAQLNILIYEELIKFSQKLAQRDDLTCITISRNPIPEDQEIRLEMEGDLKKIPDMEARIISLMKEKGVSDEICDNYSIALFEILTNSVKHGNKGDAMKKVVVRILVDNQRVTVRVRDHGQKWNFGESRLNLRELILKETHSGRGLLMVEQLMDVFFVNPSVQNGSETVLIKYR